MAHDGFAWLPGQPKHRRTLELGTGRLAIYDEVLGGHGTFASRLRVDATEAEHLRIRGAPGTSSRRDGAWYPRHGEVHPAVVFELNARTDECKRVTWTVEW
jgi:hypothetical protein